MIIDFDHKNIDPDRLAELNAADQAFTEGALAGRIRLNSDVATVVDLTGYGDRVAARRNLADDAASLLTSVIGEYSMELRMTNGIRLAMDEYFPPYFLQFDAWSVAALMNMARHHGYDVNVKYDVPEQDVLVEFKLDESVEADLNDQIEVERLKDILSTQDLNLDDVKNGFKKDLVDMAQPNYELSHLTQYRKPTDEYQPTMCSPEKRQEIVDATEAGAKKLLAYVLGYQKEAMLKNGKVDLVLGVHTNPFFLMSPAKVEQLKEIAEEHGLHVEAELPTVEDIEKCAKCGAFDEPSVKLTFQVTIGELTSYVNEEGDRISLV